MGGYTILTYLVGASDCGVVVLTVACGFHAIHPGLCNSQLCSKLATYSNAHVLYEHTSNSVSFTGLFT